MRILIYSPMFYPAVGGLETVVYILAHEFVNQGHEVKLISQTPAEANDSKTFPFSVFRSPSPQTFVGLIRWCDIYFQPNISLKGIWGLFLYPKPWVISHNGWYTRPNGRLSWQDYLKHFAIQFARGISVSQAVADSLATPSTVIPNPYREEIFYEMPEIPRDRELVFLGRLVSDKGADLLIDALGNLKPMGLTPKLTIVGQGPEEAQLRQQVETLNITEQVHFAGVKVEQELAKLLNAHQIMVVPSRWQEPFGIVALEGIACGCVVVGSEGGGLKDAIGLSGTTFPNGDVNALTEKLAELLKNPQKLEKYRFYAEKHLLNHRKEAVAKAYLKIFEEATR